MNGETTEDLVETLRAQWAEHERNIGARLAAIEWSAHQLRLDHVNEKLARARRIDYLHWVVAGLCIALLTGFNVANLHDWRYLLAGAALQAWIVVALALQVYERVSVMSVNFAKPVAALQGEIEALAIARLRAFKWLFLTGQVVWYMPFLLVVCKGLLGVDVLDVAPGAAEFALDNVIGCVVAIPVLMWLAHRVSGLAARWPMMARIVDSLAGRDIAVARQFLDGLA
jgi:hypothetical protein